MRRNIGKEGVNSEVLEESDWGGSWSIWDVIYDVLMVVTVFF